MPTKNESLHNGTIEFYGFSKKITLNSSSSWVNSETQSLSNGCSPQEEQWHSSFFGVTLALPEWEAILTVIMLSIIIVLTIVGNILVILSVFTYKPLRIVQNFFIVSLAVADLTVALLVLPFNVAYSVLGRWEFGIHLCKMWLTCDVMCCTSSILNLCVIALDRFWAITDPINYAHKRTVNRVLFLISGVWILSFVISSPPLIGWNDWPEEFLSTTPCELTSNRGYVIYSSLGSFFIPLIIMTIVYIEIYIAARRRLRERSLASKMYNISVKTNNFDETDDNTVDRERRGRPICHSTFICCCKNQTKPEDPTNLNDNVSISSEARANNNPQQQKLLAIQRSEKMSIELSETFRRDKGKSVTVSFDTSLTQYPNIKGVKTEKLKPSNSKDTQEGLAYEEAKEEVDLCSTSQNSGGNETNPSKGNLSQSLIGTCDLTVTMEKNSTGVHQFIEQKQKISLSKERRAARTLGIIMGVFVICWLPFFLMYVILPFCNTCCPTQKFKNFITWLGYINSSLNPVIYTIFNLDFRRAFKRLLGFK